MKLRLPHKFQAALIAAIAGVSSTAYSGTIGETVTPYTLPQNGGTVHQWTGGAGTTDSQSDANWTNGKPARDANGPVLVFDGANVTLTNVNGSIDTSDSGGIKVINNSIVTANSLLGRWAGSVYVEEGSELTTSYSTKLKNTEAATAANIYVDGTFNLTGSANMNISDGNKYENWHIGENGIINITNSNGSVTKASGGSWNFEFVVNNTKSYEKEIIGRELSDSVKVSKTVLTSNNAIALSNVDTYRIINTSNVLLGDETTTGQENAAKLRLDGKNWVVDYTMKGYTAATLTWNGGNNGAWENLDAGWTLNGEPATFISDNGDSVVFGSAGGKDVAINSAIVVKGVTVDEPGYTFNVTGGSLAAQTVTLNSNLSINGAGTATIGSLALNNGAGLALGAGTVLKGTAATLMGQKVTGDGAILLDSNLTLSNGTTTQATAGLIVKGATLTIGGGESQSVNISSLSHIVLDGGTISYNAAASTLNGLTVESGKTGTISVYDMNDKTMMLKGRTTVDGTLNISNTWNTQITIDKLVGGGKIAQASGGSQWMDLTINSLSDGDATFTGELSLKHNQANDDIIINTGSKAVSFKSLELAIGGHTMQFNLGADTTIGQMTLTSGTAAFTGTGKLTLGGLDGEATITGLNDLTLNVTDGAHNYTGALSIGGQLVKTGAGTQTLGGFAINETILVEGGTLTLDGTYTLDGLADDAGRTYTFQDENGDEAAKEVGGFRITNGTKTVYTETSGTVTRAEGTKFQLDGKDVTVDENGVYKFPTSADKTTLWVNGSTPLSYDTYFTASAGALTTAQVADGATLVIGTNAVGTLAFQENGTTINLDGSGTVNAISGTGTLNLNGTVTLGSALTVGDGETFATNGTGSLNAGQLNANGGITTFDTAATVTRLIVNGSAAATVGGSGAIAVSSTEQDQGVEIGVGKTLTLLSENMNVAGTIHNNGNLIVGDGTHPALVKAVYFVNGNNNGGSSSFDIKANATLVATGADTGNSHASGWVMGEWNNSTTGKVAGTLLARNASIWGCDSAYTLNIENGGLVATKGVKAKKDNQAYTVNLKEGGTLVLGGTSTPGATVLNATAGSTIGTYATSGVDYSGTIATTAVDGKAVTFDTSLYTFNEAGTAITKGDTAGELTISGAITGTAAVAKAGAGTLVLSGANTYSGGTTVNAGTLKAGSLGTGDVTVNGGTLELTSSISTQGDLSITGGTLVFAGADMLTAGSLAVSGTVTFDLTNVAATKAGTITLATATGDATGDFSGVTVNWAHPESFSHGEVYVKDHSWVIDLISMGQALTWAGGTGNWSYDEADTSWLTPGDEPTHTHFTDKDSAVFTAAVDPALANIKEAISTAGVEVQAGADVTLQAAIDAETASLTPIELNIAGRLSTSVDVAATVVEVTGADASWNITGGTVTADSITVAQDGKLALSGTGMTAETVSGPGTVVVGDGFTLTLGRQIDSDQATDLAILNNGTVAVALGSSQNVINMDAASTGTLEVTAGTISNQSALGANQTLKLNGGTIFAVKGGETAFASDIALAGNVSMQLKDSANATIAGAVSGSGKTLSVSGGAANQTITFTDTVTLGGLNVAGSGETIVFKGSGSNLGAIYAQSGAFTIQFSKEDGADSAAYTIGTFAMSPSSSTGNRWLIVDQGVTVHATGSSLDPGASISSGWGVTNGGLLVNGILTTDGAIGLEANQQTAYIKGSGIINTAGLNFCNGSHTYIQDGITINITSNRGIFARNDNAAAGDVHLKNATLQAKDADWEFKVGRAADPVTLEDTTTGTTFEAADGRTITITKVLGGTGKLVKAGEGVVKLTGANTYSGGTTVNAGTLLAQNASALGTGVVNITGGNLVIGAVMNDYSANEFHNTGGTLTMNDGSKLTMFATGGTRTYDLGNVVVNGSAGIVTKMNNSCFNAQLNMTSLVSAADGAEIVLASGAQYTKATVFNLNTNQTAAYNGTITVMESQTNAGARPVALNVALGADAAKADVLKGAVIVLDNANNDENLVGLGLGSDVTVKGIDSGNTATNGTHVIFAGAATTDNGSFSSSGEARTLTVDTAGTDHSTRAKVLDKVNLVKQGAGTQTFSGDMSSFNGSVSAEGGTLNVLNADSLAVQNVHIGEGAAFGVYSGATATASTGTEGSIAITENNVLSALENATLNANLVMEAGSTLDVSYAQDSYGLIMGSSVTLKEGVLLQDSMHQQQYPDINDFLFEYLSHNDYYYLYDSVDELYIQQGDEAKPVSHLDFVNWRNFDMDASSVFTNLSENTYALVYSWDGSNVGSVALTLIPEPTTGTLSLLALAVLAARRRRK